MAPTDFNFVLGSWAVRNRRRRDSLDASSTEWDEFASTGTHSPLLGGTGNIEAYETTEFPVDVRFVWQHVDDVTAAWEQAFSTDGGTTWDTNWYMEMTRTR